VASKGGEGTSKVEGGQTTIDIYGKRNDGQQTSRSQQTVGSGS